MANSKVSFISKLVEPTLFFIVAAGLTYTMAFLWRNYYLPEPYFYLPSDTYMDWFNVAEWSHDSGAYSSWRSVYPPLNFLFAGMFSLSECYVSPSPAGIARYARSCDWLSLVTIHVVYVLCGVVTALSFAKSQASTAFYRAFALTAGLPMTVALERGNLIMVAFLGFALGYGPLLKLARWRWVALAWAVNFKIYLVASLFAQLLHRRWRSFEGAIVASTILYVATYLIYNGGSPIEIINNIIDYSAIAENLYFTNIFYSVSYNPHITVLSNPILPIDVTLGQNVTEPLLFYVYYYTRLTQAMIVFAAVATWLRPEVVSPLRSVNLAMCFTFLLAEPNGYSYIFIVFMTFLESGKAGFGRAAVVAAYILCVQVDYPISNITSLIEDSFIGGRLVQVPLNISVGTFIRPSIFYLIPLFLSCATVLAVWKDIRTQSWKERRRFRHDLPLMQGA